ncbi:MAG: hypothetical protein M3R38_01445 [Actinomycetota bacterium]|nr:hypothetical protein [Actinomycetota bacterium]
MAPSGERGLARRTLGVAAALALGLCLLAAAILSLNAAITGWGPLSGAPSCLGASGAGFWDALTVHLATAMHFLARWSVGLSAFTTFFVAASIVGQPGIVTPRAAAEVSLFGPFPLAAGRLCSLFPMIGGC